ncbi:MAG: YhbD family protein [Candidatus Aquicultorales bacterium]
MNEELISKKQLLRSTGISYGQLYRWKRKNLIPEEWFIRKSTFTGQETFFPKDKILARINRIKNLMEEDLSLDNIADYFSPNPAEISLKYEELAMRRIVSNASLRLFMEERGEVDQHELDNRLPFASLLEVYAIDTLLRTGDISLEEGRIILQVLEESYEKFEGKSCDLLFVRKLGVPVCALVSSVAQVVIESGARLVARLNLTTLGEELRTKVTEGS